MLDPTETCGGFSREDFTLISDSPQETYNFGKFLGEKLQPRDLVALCGELGAGKTCLTQGIARGLGVPEEYRVTSPTFTIINEYPGRLTLYHLDMYRLSGVRDLDEIGYDDCFNDRGVVVMEWAEKIKEVLPETAFFISLTYISENKRKIVLSHNRKEINRLFTEKS
ncbi:MAG: tRNA (adenosine(37)-N6)-threonylcarbamoyltransferase complex ATPase subunit type 1 TsaE [Deltaproteobacteria bacterium]|nr:tRNA (adenosine(37)-N6)-threonylcarbamoyltransferase complex ATPase subunit type 1 TsaE [Deltaproteobacteria bacterium]